MLVSVEDALGNRSAAKAYYKSAEAHAAALTEQSHKDNVANNPHKMFAELVVTAEAYKGVVDDQYRCERRSAAQARLQRTLATRARGWSGM